MRTLSSPFIFEAVPVLDPRPENTGPYRFSDEPAGGQSRQGLISDTMRPWRRSNAPARQTGIGSAILPGRTMELWCQQQHSGLLIRTVRVRIPPAPP